jgi:hypothetical protein
VTKDEFIDEFIAAAGLPKSARTPDGVRLGSFHRIAVPCEAAKSADGVHYHSDVGLKCKGWLLIEPPGAPKGGVYSVRRHV